MTGHAENPSTDKTEPSRRLGRRRGVWIAYWVAIFAMTHVPIERSGPPLIPNADKAVHLTAYFVLTLLGGWALLSQVSSRGKSSLLFWAGVYAIYGMADELTQPFVNRTASVGDWLADAIGILLATIFLVVAAKRRGRSDETPNASDDTGS